MPDIRPAGYNNYRAMIQRCEDKKRHSFHRYGGRGIKVCERWRQSFAAFVADVGPIPSDQHELDRIDNNGNYEPGNVRWALRSQQMRNTSTNRLIAYGGKIHCLKEWSEILGIPYKLLHCRLVKHGWSIKRSFETPYRPRLTEREKANATLA